MKLSIIVPVYKVRRHIQSCIESILMQTYTDFELILVDDGSPDSCGAICDRYAQECDKVKVIHKKNGGLSSARNAGLAVAQGEYITFVDGDDTVASGTYYYNMRILQANPDIDILEFPVNVHYESPRSHILTFNAEKVSGNKNIFVDYIKRKAYEHCYAWNKIYRADMFFFTRYPEGEVFEDVLVTPTLYENCDNVYYSDGGIYYYYAHDDGITRSYSFKSQYCLYKNLVILYKKVKNDYKMTEEANEILLKAIDNLTDLLRCSDGKKEERNKAFELLRGEGIGLKTLFKMGIPLLRKLKFTTFALMGAKTHCTLTALLHKKLC
ncbi:MAG: glycosyltransferase [Bacteroidaceae bacterium]|nr:glycosyltransferase [Bacteroidaceae bacterium]